MRLEAVRLADINVFVQTANIAWSTCGLAVMEVDSTVPVIQNMLLLDSEGKRIAVKYFDQQW